MKSMKKALSLILALIMLSSCLCSVAAYAADDYDHLPQIYVEGYESKKIYYKDDPEQKPLFYPIDSDMLFTKLGKYKEYLQQATLYKDPNLLYTVLCNWMQDCYGMVALGKDGYTMNEEVTVPETTLNYKGEGKYVFKYDSRLDPVDLARDLDEYIEWVQEDSGSERFELAGSSFGSSIVLAYLHEYPEKIKNIDSVVLCVPSSNGVDFASELFSSNINTDAATLVDFVNKTVDNEDIKLLLSLFDKTGTLDAILGDALVPVLRVALSKALRTVILEIFGTFPSMWSFVRDDYFYAAVENIYGPDYADPNHEYAVHIQKITYYHEEIMNHNSDIIRNAIKNGIKVNIISKYGEPSIPLSSNSRVLGDGFVTLKDASFGAICSLHKETLPDDYQQAMYPEYKLLSPDNRVDASTCLIPFNTWFVKGLTHGGKNDAYYELINTILYDDLDIFADSEFPQYLEVPAEDDEALVPMKEAAEEEKETSWLQDFFKLIARMFNIIIEKIKGMFVKE